MTGLKNKTERVLEHIREYCPEISREISEVIRSFSKEPEEIRLRSGGVSSVRISGIDYALLSRVGKDGIDRTLESVCKGALYAHRDTIMDGYVTIEGGVRVGVGGRASYSGGECVGICEISSLVFRIPSGVCDFGEEIYEKWRSRGSSGMLIISPPAGGKTTALRSLAKYIAKERRTVIADERCEFDPDDYRGAFLDILRGYKRSVGIEIAVRTMSPEVIMCDEIFTEGDRDALLGALGAGVTVVATAHGGTLEGVRRRRCISDLFDDGMFSSVVTVVRSGGKFSYKFEDIS